MADIYNGNLTMTDDWGLVINEEFPDGAPASGEAIQRFIKDHLQAHATDLDNKPALFYAVDDTDGNANILLAFKTASDLDEWKAKYTVEGANPLDGINPETEPLVLTAVSMNKATPQPYYAITLENHTPTGNTYVSTDNKVVLSLKVVSRHFVLNDTGSNLVPTVITEDVDIFFERRKNNTENWTPLIKNVPISTISSMSPDASPMEVDLSAALTDGYQEVRIMAVGKTSNQTTPWTQFNITKTQLQLELATDWTIPQSTGVLKLAYYLTGEVDKNLNIRILDSEGDRIITEYLGTATYPKILTKSFAVPDIVDASSDKVKIISHGVKTIEAWLSLAGNDKVTSDKVISQIMIVTDPLDETPYIILNGMELNEEDQLVKTLTNWTNQSIFKYALYHPTKDKIPFSMVLRDFNAAEGDSYLAADWPEIETRKELEYQNTIEVESNDSIVYAELKLSSNGILLTDPLNISIDNTGGYSPTAGADFILNPRLRSNDESQPATIINTVDKSVINSTWTGFDFSRDGWIADDKGNRCLRVLSGQELTIDYHPFIGWQDKDATNNSCTIEFSFAVRNISNEDTPIIRMCRYKEGSNNYDGWEQTALEAVYMTNNKYNRIKQDVWFTEGTMTHVAINIVHNLINGQNFCRLFVNGRINREFTYTEDTLADAGENALLENARKIIIGNTENGADIDIYGLRVYKKKLASSDILQDYISNLPTVGEKQAEKLANDIINPSTGLIDYSLVSRRYNTLLWKFNEQTPTTRMVGLAESVKMGEDNKPTGADTKKTKVYGDLVIRVFEQDENGNQVIDPNTGLPVLDKKRSGTINNMSAKGQGTSSMYYWKWNQRWEFIDDYEQADFEKGYRNSVFTPLELSENYDLVEDYTWEANDKGEYEVVNNSKWHSKEKDELNQPIEIIDDKRTGSWQPEPGQPFAKRLDGKINYASPMQSHKLGSVCMYNDLWKEVIKDNEITKIGATPNGVKFTGTSDGYKSCRVAVIQRPFLVFCQKSANDPIEFYGLYTMGPSKGDKPTFGYNKKDFPNFVMMEGCDNGAKLVRCLVPWNDIDIKPEELDDDGSKVFEIFYIGKDEQWEISMGSTDVDTVCNVTKVDSGLKDDSGNPIMTNEYGPVGSGSNPVFAHFREWCNFCYQLNPKLKCWDKGNGSYADLMKAQNKELVDSQGNTIIPDVNYVYWTISGTAIPSNKELVEGTHYIYNTYRYDADKAKWVHCGIEYDSTGNDYVPLNISVQTGYTPTTGTREVQNQNFITRRVQAYKSGIGKYVDERDMRYTMLFLKLIAGSDNWAKNTYIYNAGLTDENGNLTSKWRFFQDDLDTILSLDNSGYKVKPYYVEEHDTYINEQGETVGYWNASDNAMYCLAEMAWENEMRAMMREILSAMAMPENGGSVEGCFDKYYNSVTRYFPAVAYNEITRLLYEDAEVNRANGLYTYGNTVDPLAQAVGDQLQSETQWQRQRSIYLSSYASYGTFASGSETSTGSLAFRAGGETGTSSEMRFEFTPSMWLYPSMANGSSSVNGVVLKPGETPNYNFNPSTITNPPRVAPGEKILFKTMATADQTVTLRGIDYYTDLGDFGQVSASSKYGFPLSGRKLEQFKITDDNGVITLLPSSLSTPETGMDNIKRIEIRGKVANNVSIVGGELNLSGLWRLNHVDLTATSITSLVLPSKSNVSTLKLPSTLESISLVDQPKLGDLSLLGVRNVTTLQLSKCPKLSTYDLFNRIYEAGNKLQSCYIDDIAWENVTIKQLIYLCEVYDCTLKGVITLKDNEILDFNTKARLLSKFGDIDDENNDLYIEYEKVNIQTGLAKIVGESYITKDGQYDYILSVNGNAFKKIVWSISDNNFATMTSDGKLTYKNIDSDAEREATITCTVTIILSDGSIGDKPFSKKVYFYEKDAEVGDYVYYDGTISTADDYNPSKTVIGICFYVNPNDKTDRRMVSVANVANVCWGLSNGADANSIPGLDSKYYDVAKIANIGGSMYSVNMSDLEDSTQPDGFKYYSPTDKLGDIGLFTLDNILTTEKQEFPIGTQMPIGKKKTLEIIEHRNEVVLKSNIDTGSHTLRIPGKNELDIYSYDEWTDLTNTLLNDVTNKLGEKYQAYYYPAASYCYAYKPSVKENEQLNEKFNSHHWYLPTYAEMARVWYWQKKGLYSLASSASDHNFFTAIKDTYWTSTESSVNNVWPVTTSGEGLWSITIDKSSKGHVRPVASF